MSTKEAVIELIRQMPENVTIEEIVVALQSGSAARPPEEKQCADELGDEEWSRFVAQGLAEELNDPRQDIYTLDDGVPSDRPR